MESSTDKIIQKLKGSGYSPNVIEHDPVITMDDVVRTLNIPTDAMAKTVILSQKEIGLIAAILPGMSRVDFSKVATVFGVSGRTVKFAGQEVIKQLSLNPGEACPFHDFFKRRIVDTALLRQQVLYCGSGDPQRTIAIGVKEMVQAIGATIADISQSTSVNTQTEGGSDE